MHAISGWNRLAAPSLPQSLLCNPEQIRHRGVPTLPIVTTRCRDPVQSKDHTGRIPLQSLRMFTLEWTPD
jgi:hypothetical protein